MAPSSDHVPYIFKYKDPGPEHVLNVFYLQRMSESDRQQVIHGLSEKPDEDLVQRLIVDVAQPPAPRKLQEKKWIRDYVPGPDVILAIAKDAVSTESRKDENSYTSIIFVDRAWDLGNVIATHWETAEDGETKALAAVRVPMRNANFLLTACDKIEGLTLARCLGLDAYEHSRVNLYEDLKGLDEMHMSTRIDPDFQWPSHLPASSLQNNKPTIISLRHLSDEAISTLKQRIMEGQGSDNIADDVIIHNWQGPEPTRRTFLRDMLITMQIRSSDPEAQLYAFFVDYMLHGEEARSRQILAVSRSDRLVRDESSAVEVLPVFTEHFLRVWDAGKMRKDVSEEGKLVDIWKVEHVDDLNASSFDHAFNACPVFFLQPFTADQEREIRKLVCGIGQYEEGEDWGHTFTWFGYIFPPSTLSSDSEAATIHTLEDLRDQWEASDPFSPFFDAVKAGPIRMHRYPSNFIAVDEKIFDKEEPKVWLASSLDFHGEDTSDSLGWIYGRVAPRESYNCWCNLDIANIGPEELVDAPAKKLWLSDLKAYREEDWDGDQDEDGVWEEQGDGSMEWRVKEDEDGSQDSKDWVVVSSAGVEDNGHGVGDESRDGAGSQDPGPRKGGNAPRKLLGGPSVAD
ncbi:uncharacterized protein AB675_7001 [Cyphellophora attinorum]|uniref:Uncharacterized protein n=1 Tax=Cyphellophora attinorum TaxID=1664694 RepID=A0A0N1H8E9_9EURO|nr:uncharacterized protein AB675_7001 [Phialophora attinorum]KPI43235.1 hypothetical protein AB675_7001 [Phialophora attinorum]